MKQTLDFNLLRKRREQMLKTRKKIELHSGQHYPVIAFFPVSGQSEAAQDKLRYLINGEKR